MAALDGWTRAVLAGLAQLLFSSRPLPGVLTALGLAAYSPWMLLGAGAGVAIGTAIERRATGLDHRLWRDGVGGINPAILGVLACGYLADPDAHLGVFVVLCVLCTVLAAAMRRGMAKFGLYAFSAPAYLVAVAASLVLQGPGTWWWMGIARAGDIPAGLWVTIACMIGAITWESPAAAGWTACATLLSYSITLLLGMTTAESFDLWGIVVPLAAFGAQRLFAGRSPAAPRIAAVAAISSGILWWLWHEVGIDRIAPPLFAPAILALWGMMLVHNYRLRAKAKTAAPPLLLQRGCTRAAIKLWCCRLAGRPVVVATGAAPIEDTILRNAIGDGMEFRASMVETRAGRRRLWEASDSLRGAEKPPALDIGADFVVAGDCIGQGTNRSRRIDAAGRADRTRCLGCGCVAPAPPIGLWRRLELTCARCGGQIVPDIRRLVPLDPATMRTALDAALPGRAVCIVLPGAVDSSAAPMLLERIRPSQWHVIQIGARSNEALPGAIAVSAEPARLLRLFTRLGCVRRQH